MKLKLLTLTVLGLIHLSLSSQTYVSGIISSISEDKLILEI